MNRDDLELYTMAEYDGDAAALEDELARDDAGRAVLAEEARLELLLRDAAAGATFCPACDDLVRGARCDACGAAVRPGGYVVERVLVSNAHGRMYAARDADGKQVALKELAFVQSPTVEVIAAFEREVKFLRALDHPAIPRFCASFEEGAGVHVRYYLAQELVAGESLADRLDAHWYSEAEIVGIARQVLDVLVYLQGLSPMVIHRDIKPANLVVRADGTIAVVDFGAAHVQGMTVGSTAIGTFGYMPIEQLAGEVDATTDPYALGASLLHLVTRKEPWRILHGGTLAGLELNLSRPMRAFLCKLVAPQTRDRFRSAADARAALDGLARGRRPIRAALARLPRRSLLAVTAAAALAVTAAAALAVIGVGGNTYWSEAVDGRTTAFEARQAAMLAWMVSLRDLACRCTDKHCVDEVNQKVASWTQAVVAEPLSTPMMNRANVLGAQMSVCMKRVLPWLTLGSVRSHEFEPVIAGAPAPEGTRAELRGTEMPVHEAARELADACGVNVVVSGRITADLGAQQGPIPCERALATVVTWSGLHSRRYADWASADAASPEHGVFEIADPQTTSADEARRDAFAERGFIDGPAPLLRGTTVRYALYQVPVKSVIQQLASDANLALAIPDSVDGAITVFARDAAWDAVFAAVIDAASLGYRYYPPTKQLYVAPLAELHRGQQGAAPYAFLDVNPEAIDHATLVIEGTVTEVPPGRRIAVPAGMRRLELRKPDGARTTYTVNVKSGSHHAIPDSSNPEVWENHRRSGDPQPAPPER